MSGVSTSLLVLRYDSDHSCFWRLHAEVVCGTNGAPPSRTHNAQCWHATAGSGGNTDSTASTNCMYIQIQLVVHDGATRRPAPFRNLPGPPLSGLTPLIDGAGHLAAT